MPASSFTVHHLDEVDSTNTWLIAAARQGAADRTVAVADFQTHGRGRRDRQWSAPPGSGLLCSVLLRVRLVPADLHLATIAVALSARRACEQLYGVEGSLKWPNDLMVGDRKLGGILAETEGPPAVDGSTGVVVGLGVNLTTVGPADAGGTSITTATGEPCNRDDLLAAYLEELDAEATRLATPRGRRELLDAYRARLSTLGRSVRVELADTSLVGVAIDVTEVGHLVVDVDGVRTIVAAGDVVHLRPHQQGPQNPPE